MVFCFTLKVLVFSSKKYAKNNKRTKERRTDKQKDRLTEKKIGEQRGGEDTERERRGGGGGGGGGGGKGREGVSEGERYTE